MVGGEGLRPSCGRKRAEELGGLSRSSGHAACDDVLGNGGASSWIDRAAGLDPRALWQADAVREAKRAAAGAPAIWSMGYLCSREF